MAEVENTSRSSSESPVILENPEKKSLLTEPEEKGNPSTPVSEGKKVSNNQTSSPKASTSVDPTELFRWKKPIQSFSVFAGGLLVYYFLYVKSYSVLTLVTYVLMLNIAINGAINCAVKPAKYLGVLSEDAKAESYYFYVTEVAKAVYSNEAVSHVRKQIMDSLVNFEEGKVRNALKVSSGPAVTQAIGSLYLLSVFGQLFSIATIALISFIAAFTYPNVYAKYGKEIDEFLATATTTVKKTVKDASATAVKSVPALEKPLILLGAHSIEKNKSE